ncbi:hypothetical protein FACS189476_08430 [Spirochaetia bacterium]|nr:hypothetical protein FACS189476_08430 [Spirochaetia bacterium]
MTAEQKTHLASFLDLTADTLRGGYTRDREPYAFSDNIADETPRPLVMLIGDGIENSGAAGQLLDKMLASIGLFRGKNCVSGNAEQIDAFKPRFILCLGAAAGRSLNAAVPLLGTYHPDELLLDASLKRPAWEDLKTLRSKLMELDQDYARSMAGRP